MLTKRLARKFSRAVKLPDSMKYTPESEISKTLNGVTVYSQKMFQGLST